MNKLWMGALGILAVAGAAGAAKADDMHVVPLSHDQWPATIYLDVSAANCEGLGGKLQGRLGSQVCYIASADCESHAGFKVVTRDAYKVGAARFIACHKM